MWLDLGTSLPLSLPRGRNDSPVSSSGGVERDPCRSTGPTGSREQKRTQNVGATARQIMISDGRVSGSSCERQE